MRFTMRGTSSISSKTGFSEPARIEKRESPFSRPVSGGEPGAKFDTNFSKVQLLYAFGNLV